MTVGEGYREYQVIFVPDALDEHSALGEPGGRPARGRLSRVRDGAGRVYLIICCSHDD